MLKLRLKIKTFILLSLNLLMFLLLGAEAQAEAVNRGGQTFETSTENPNANDESSQKLDQNSKEISEADQNPVAVNMSKPGERLEERIALSKEEALKQQAFVNLANLGIEKPTDTQIEKEIEKLREDLRRAESNEAKRQTAVAAAPASGGGGGSGSLGGLGIAGVATALAAIPLLTVALQPGTSIGDIDDPYTDHYKYKYRDDSGQSEKGQFEIFNDTKAREFLEDWNVRQAMPERKGQEADSSQQSPGKMTWVAGVDDRIKELPNLPDEDVARLRAVAERLDAANDVVAVAEAGDVDFYCQGEAEVQDHCKSFFGSVPSIANFVKAKQQVLDLEIVSQDGDGDGWKPALKAAKLQVSNFAAKLKAQASALRRARDDQSSPQGKRLLENVALLFDATAKKVAESNDREELEKLFKALDGKDWNDYVKAHEKFGLPKSALSSEGSRDATSATRELFASAMNPSLSYAELSAGEPGAGEARHPSLGRGGFEGPVTPDGDSLDLRGSERLL